MKKYIVLFLFVLILVPAGMPMAQDGNDEDGAMSDEEYEAMLDKGKKVYSVRCLLCHGENGDGNGFAGVIRRAEKSGRVLEIYPRDLSMAVFRFRSTPTGCLADDQDLIDIISNGVPRSFMPAHKELSKEDIEATKEYIKTFSFRWEEEDACDPIAVMRPDWVGSSESVIKGKKIYQDMKCGECHGYEGKGDGPKSNDLKDDWGKQILPFNFATGDLKRGSSADNVYITFTTGLDGTGMPSYEDSLNEDDRWHLVSYTLKLMKK